MKSHLLILTLFLNFTAFAGDVSWLEKVTAPPADFLTTTPLQPALLTADDNTTISTVEKWLPKRAEIRNRWLDILGPLPQAPADGFKLEPLADESLDTCTRTLVRYEAEPGRFVRAYILHPTNNDKTTTRPGVVVFHPTNKDSIKVVAGTGGRREQHIGLKLAERGFVVICPENYINEEPTWNAAVAKAKERHPDSLGMATMLADGMRAVDILQTLPGVDPNRIATIGHSLGAKEALYLMAFDDRVQAAVSSEGGIGISFSNWDANWYLGPGVNEPEFTHDHHELLALIAPRPFLVFGGETGRAADGDRTWRYLLAARPVYELYGSSVRLGLINHHEEHSFKPPQVEKAIEWLETYIQSPR